MANDWVQQILTFWFEELDRKQWWSKDEDLDAEITERFCELWEEQKSKVADDFMGSPQSALAAIILFDQFPRNMFRGRGQAFSTDHLARQIADKALELEYDDTLPEKRRAFMYMPFMHSENLEDQNTSLTMFTRLGSNIEYAKSHRDMIAKFGRFPHRNAVLGRETRPEEEEAVAKGSNW